MSKYIYIKYEVPKHYIELKRQINPDIYGEVGTTWQDFMDNKWVLLSEEQVAFRQANPNASVMEVWNMALTPEPERTIDEAKREKTREISLYDASSSVNGFTINGSVEAWFTVQERLNYKESINAAKLLGKEEVSFFVGDLMMTVNCDAAIGMLAQIQDYADQCYIATKQHKLAVAALETIEAVDAYDYRVGYPERLNFNLA